jgi:PPK2 family polyphosphate:nucleotide phosphotransferase
VRQDLDEFIRPFVVPPGTTVSFLKEYDPGYQGDYASRADAADDLKIGVELLAEQQDMLYAQNRHALLIVLQAMDAAGKDSTIKHVMSGVNPQGCQVFSFKAPSQEELDHDFLWRAAKALPERGRIGIFNRSYYEEVLVVRVHPELLKRQRLPALDLKHIWRQRFEQINQFEKYLTATGTVILKFFLHISKEQQRQRFLRRIDEAEKNWKFSAADVHERAFWDEYMRAYADAFNHTSTEWAPWHIIPADHKWFTRVAVAAVICATLKKLDLCYPTITPTEREELQKAKALLDEE